MVTTPAFSPPAVTPQVAGPDLAMIKVRQQETWASGDYARVAGLVVFPAEQLCETLNPQAGWRVLDVATGSGNAALAAARRGCTVVGVDYVPSLLQAGRKRAEAEQVEVAFIEGDAESLPLPRASFDAVLSIFGAMFTPDHRRTASEMARVCRPGGVIGLASWTPDGFIGEMFRLIAKYRTPAPNLTPPVRWGAEDHLRGIFGDAIGSIRSQRRTAVMRFASAEEDLRFFQKYYGPTLKTFEALDPSARATLERDMVDLIQRFDRNGSKDGPVAVAADYLETIIVRA